MLKTGSITQKVLIIENSDEHLFTIGSIAGEECQENEYIRVHSIAEAKRALREKRYDAVITDYLLRDGTVFDLFSVVEDTPIIVVTGSGNEEVAVKAMKEGAYDYVVRDNELSYLKVLPLTIKNAINRKKSEQRLQLLESAVASANDAIIILEAEPGEMKGRRILYVNEAFTRMTGYSFQEATSRTLRMLRGPKTSLSALNRIRVALEKRLPVRVELINYRKDGSEFWAECNIVPFADEKGSFIHWVSVQRNITRRKKAEQEKEQLMKKIETINADLTELNRELETIGAERTMSLMALTVADRIRNPTAMIGARCRRLLEKNDLSEDLKSSLKYIMEGSETLETIVRDFEKLLQEKQYSFKMEDLNHVVEKVGQVIEKEASFKGIQLNIHMSGESMNMKMQKDLMRVAIYHIMKNALESTSRGGTVTVRTFKEADYVMLSISDSGYGIPVEEIEDIFRPFFSTKERGYGMGLPLVKQIVSEHLGKLSIESESGQGTTITLMFPVNWISKSPCCGEILP